MFEKSPGFDQPVTSDEEASRAPPGSPIDIFHLLRLTAIAVVLVAGAILLARAFV